MSTSMSIHNVVSLKIERVNVKDSARVNDTLFMVKVHATDSRGETHDITFFTNEDLGKIRVAKRRDGKKEKIRKVRKQKAIVLHASSIDGMNKRRGFSTLTGAQKWAWKIVGHTPELGSTYAVSGDGITKVTIGRGTTLNLLFPGS